MTFIARGIKIKLVPDYSVKSCQWIEGEPKDRNFCGKRTQPHSSYCEEHHRRCYQEIDLSKLDDTRPLYR